MQRHNKMARQRWSYVTQSDKNAIKPNETWPTAKTNVNHNANDMNPADAFFSYIYYARLN